MFILKTPDIVFNKVHYSALIHRKAYKETKLRYCDETKVPFKEKSL